MGGAAKGAHCHLHLTGRLRDLAKLQPEIRVGRVLRQGSIVLGNCLSAMPHRVRQARTPNVCLGGRAVRLDQYSAEALDCACSLGPSLAAEGVRDPLVRKLQVRRIGFHA